MQGVLARALCMGHGEFHYPGLWSVVDSAMTVLRPHPDCSLLLPQHTCQLTGRNAAIKHRRPLKSRLIVAQSGENTSGQPSRAEALDRIRKATEYKTEPTAKSGQAGDDRERLDEQVSPFASIAAAREEESFTAALAERQQRAPGDTAASSEPSMPVPQPTNQLQRTASGQSLREAAMRRIADARRYVDSKSTSSQPGTSAPPALLQPMSQPAEGSAATEWGRSGAGSSQQVCLLDNDQQYQLPLSPCGCWLQA